MTEGQGQLWTRWRHPARFVRMGAVVAIVTTALAFIPVEVRMAPTGRVGVAVKPILWGLPTEEALQNTPPDSVVWGGCALPLNPPLYAVVISW